MGFIDDAYVGQTVLVTGCTGFVGKVMLEKLMRELPQIERIFVLIRPKRDRSVSERFEREILSSPLFDPLKEKLGKREFDQLVARKIVPLPGDILQDQLGIQEPYWTDVVEHVSVTLHVAATVSFDEPILDALNQNVYGALRALEVSRACKNMKIHLHISTGYVNADLRGHIAEEIYDPPFHPEQLLERLQRMSVDELEMRQKEILGKHPNTYTFTKNLAENLIKRRREDLPVAIVRPTIVLGIHKDPIAGFIDSMAAAGGLYAAFGYGVLRFMPITDPNDITDQVPVDHVSSCSIAVAAYQMGKNELAIYHSGTSHRNPITWRTVSDQILPYWATNPTKGRLLTPAFQWIPTHFAGLPWFELQFLLRFKIPLRTMSFILSTIGERKQASLLAKVLRKMVQYTGTMRHFVENEWVFETTNSEAIWAKMSEDELERFCFDALEIDWYEYIRKYTYGLRKFASGEKGLKPFDSSTYFDPPLNTVPLSLRVRPFGDVAFGFNSALQFTLDGTVFDPVLLRKLTMRSAPVLAAIEAEVAGGVGREKVERRAQEIMKTMAGEVSIPALRVFAYMMRKVFRRLYESISVNETGLDMVRDVFSRGEPVLILPTHRSYIDFLVVSYLLFAVGLPIPQIAAGDDFLHMLIVRWVFRKAGAYFMRRTFGDDELYRAIFTEYTQRVLMAGAPLEFFLEGTRSRSGKCLYPKLGLLRIALDTWFTERVDYMHVLPVCINYERLVDEGQHVREVLGEKKEKPSLRKLLNALTTVLALDYGRISVQWGKPLELSEYVQRCHPEVSVERREEIPVEMRKQITSEVAFYTMRELDANKMVMTTALVATLVMTNRQGLTHKELVSDFKWLRGEILDHGYWVDTMLFGPKEVVQRAIDKLGDNLTLTSQRYHVSIPVVGGINDYRHWMHLAYSRNSLLSIFIYEAMVSVAMHSLTVRNSGYDVLDDGVLASELLPRAVELGRRMRKEYIPSVETLEQRMEMTITYMLERHTIVREGDRYLVATTGRRYFTWLCGLVSPFIDAYWLMSLSILSALDGRRYLGDRALLERAQWLGDRLFRSGLLVHYESRSKETLNNALRSFEEDGVVERLSNTKPISMRATQAYSDIRALEKFVQGIQQYRKVPFTQLCSSPDVTIHELREAVVAEFPLSSKW